MTVTRKRKADDHVDQPKAKRARTHAETKAEAKAESKKTPKKSTQKPIKAQFSFPYTLSPETNKAAFRKLFNIGYTKEHTTPYVNGKLYIAPVKKLQEALGTSEPIYGLFAHVPIKKGKKETPILEYAGEIISTKQCKIQESKGETHYAMAVAGHGDQLSHYVCALHTGNGGRFVNHSDNPNVEYVCTGEGKLFLIPIRDIAAGEQLVASYGSLYPFESKIPNQSHHGPQSDAEVYAENKDHYVDEKKAEKRFVKAIKTISGAQHKYVFPENFIKNKKSSLSVDAPIFQLEKKGEEKQTEITKLMLAAYLHDLKLVEKLRNQGADLDRHDDLFRTPLHYLLMDPNFSDQEKAEAVNFLLDMGADPFIGNLYAYCVENDLVESLDQLPPLSPIHFRFECPILKALKLQKFDMVIKLLSECVVSSFKQAFFNGSEETARSKQIRQVLADIDKQKADPNDAFKLELFKTLETIKIPPSSIKLLFPPASYELVIELLEKQKTVENPARLFSLKVVAGKSLRVGKKTEKGKGYEDAMEFKREAAVRKFSQRG